MPAFFDTPIGYIVIGVMIGVILFGIIELISSLIHKINSKRNHSNSEKRN